MPTDLMRSLTIPCEMVYNFILRKGHQLSFLNIKTRLKHFGIKGVYAYVFLFFEESYNFDYAMWGSQSLTMDLFILDWYSPQSTPQALTCHLCDEVLHWYWSHFRDMCEDRPTYGSGLEEFPWGHWDYASTCFVFHLTTLIKTWKGRQLPGVPHLWN